MLVGRALEKAFIRTLTDVKALYRDLIASKFKAIIYCTELVVLLCLMSVNVLCYHLKLFEGF